MTHPRKKPFAQFIENPRKFRAPVLTRDEPDHEDSPAPPKTGHLGESQPPRDAEPSPEVEADKQLTEIVNSPEESSIHHQHQTAATSGDAVEKNQSAADEDDATSEMIEAWGELTGFIADAQSAAGSPGEVRSVVNVADQAKAARNYQKVTLGEEDRLLMCISMGMSMRAAARAIGCHHTTFVKRAKRDKDFASAIEQAKQQARADPLRELYAASRKSWRAAAWLLEYLDRKQRLGGERSKAT